MNYYIGVDNSGLPYIAHYGVAGMKKGVRRYQNPDGSLTPEGMEHYGIKVTSGEKRYLNNNGTLNKRGVKKVAKSDYRAQIRELQKRANEENAKFDKQKTKILYGFDSGSVGNRAKKYMENEYARSQTMAKTDQKALDAKRAYRTAIGKKKVDTWTMKLEQEGIKNVQSKDISEFTRDYIKRAASEAIRSAASAYNAYDERKRKNNS